MSPPRAFVTRHVYPGTLAILQESADVDYRDDRDGMSREEFHRRIAGCHALVCQLTDRVDGELMAAAPDLRVIANVAVGYDNIDVAAATERGIVVTNTPGVLTDATADLTLALLLASARRIVEADRFVRDGRWRQWEIDLLCGADLGGARLGIVGMGRIGRAVARRALAFGMEVVFWNRSALHSDDVREFGTQVSRDELLATSDFVSLHVAMTAETAGWIDADALSKMKPSATLINTARGGVVDQAALVTALQRREIATAALDVFDDEPNVPSELLELEHVLVAPHIGSANVGTRTRMCRMAAENAAAVLAGGRPANPVNPEVLG